MLLVLFHLFCEPNTPLQEYELARLKQQKEAVAKGSDASDSPAPRDSEERRRSSASSPATPAGTSGLQVTGSERLRKRDIIMNTLSAALFGLEKTKKEVTVAQPT